MSIKKILAIDQGEYLGGAEMFFSDLLTRLDHGYEIHLLCGAHKIYQDRYKGSSVKIHELDMPKLKPIGIRTYKKYRETQKKLGKIIREINPDMIISNTARAHMLISSPAKKLNLPLVWMAHDRTFPKLLLKYFLKYPDIIISCSKFVQGYYRGAYGKRNKIKFEVLYPFGTDAEQVEKLSTVRKKKIIGMVGKFIPWKGQDIFSRAVKEIKQKHPEYKFKIIGSPYRGNAESEKYSNDCRSLIREFNLESSLTIRESVPDVLREIAQWEILIHCSREPEPLGRVVLEGMAAGCAVIASALGGPCEIIRTEETGLLTVPDEENLEKNILKLISNPKMRKNISRKGRKEILKKYLWKNTISRFKELIS